MSGELRIDMVPRELYYHEKAYVRGLEQRIEALEAELQAVWDTAPFARAKRIEALEAALRDIQRYSVGDPRPRHTWYYDRAEAALAEGQDK